jgi:rhodanese-related sulfurtransferase
MMARLMGLRTISPADVLRLTREGRAIAIDVNAPGSWLQARVPGAVNLDPAAYDLAALPADKAAALVFYCSNPLCRKAPTAALRARRFGYENTWVMSAGIKGWLGAHLPVESGPAPG